jgi:hypothetical protein
VKHGGLNKEEAAAIRSLKRLAKRWPKSLDLWAMAGSLYVAKVPPGEDPCCPKTRRARDELVVAEIMGIPCDGGDW